MLSVLGQPYSAPAAAATAAIVRVGSFNIQSVSLDATVGNQRPWKTRRPGVIADILGERSTSSGSRRLTRADTSSRG